MSDSMYEMRQKISYSYFFRWFFCSQNDTIFRKCEVNIIKIYCSYSQELHEFLNKAVELVMNKYGTQLNLITLKEIELIKKEEIPYETDGKVLNASKIIVTSRLYELLPTLEVDALSGNDDFGM